METKDKGEMAEAIAVASLKRDACTVLTPFGDNAQYDLVYDTGNELLKAQVKHATMRNGCVEFNTSRHPRGPKKKYTSDEVDVFIVYSPETNKVYEVPFDDAPKGKMALRVKEPEIGSPNINWAEDYERP